jgi:hypothetical protein
VGTRCADHVAPLYPQKLALTSPTGGGRSVGIVRSRTKATEFLSLGPNYALPSARQTPSVCVPLPPSEFFFDVHIKQHLLLRSAY